MIPERLREVLEAKLLAATSDARDQEASSGERDEALLEAAGITALFVIDRCATALERIAAATERLAGITPSG